MEVITIAANSLTGLSVTRSSTVSLAARTGQHALYIVPYTTGGDAVPSPATDYTELVFSPFEVAGTNNGSDLTRIDRVVVPQRGAISYDDQEIFLPVVSGDPLLTALITRAVTNETSATAGEKMAFWRFYNDRAFYEGELLVQNVRQVGDPDADDGYQVTLRVLKAERFEASSNVAVPVASAVSPSSGAVGITVFSTGTDLNTITSARFNTAAGATTATQSTFAVKTATRLEYAVPAGLAAATAYTVVYVYPGGTVAGGTFTTS